MKYCFLAVVKTLFLGTLSLGVAVYLTSCKSNQKKESFEKSPGMNQSSAQGNSSDEISDVKGDDSKSAADTVIDAKPKATLSELEEAIKSKHLETIHKVATQVLAGSPKDKKALNALGIYYHKKNKYLAAQYLFNRALEVDEKNSQIYNNIGINYLARKENREAIMAFRKALEIDNGNVIAASNLGALYLYYKNFNKANTALGISYSKGMRDSILLNNYAASLVGLGQYEQALGLYEEALKKNPSQRETLFNYSILLIEHMGKFKEGLEVIEKLRFVGPVQEMRNKINLLEKKANTGLK